MKYVIWLVTGGIVALLLSIGVVIPIVESSAYTTVSNGETEGMTYDLYDTPVSKTILFTPDVSNMTYNAKIWTQPGDVMTEMNGTLNSMYLFASDYLMVYLDASLNIRILKADPGNSLASLVPTGYPLDSTTISIANYDVTVTVGSRNIACNGAIDTFAYIPTVDGAYGSYNHGGINLIGNEINVASA